MERICHSVIPQEAGRRLDLLLAQLSIFHALGLSRTALQKLISQGAVLLDGSVIAKPHYKVKPGERIEIVLPQKKDEILQAENIPLTIVYEDAHLAVVNKPCGMVVHPAPGNNEHTLVNALLAVFGKLSDINPQRPGIVHRLDKATSGLLVVARNNPAHLHLARQFAEHSIIRKYSAIVRGRMEFDENIIEAPIGRHPQKRKSMAVSYNRHTKYAKTYYRTLKRGPDASLLELEPFTGRTHQLRVHLAFAGHPILGDEKYGLKSEFPRLALHAHFLGFVHPATNKKMEFSSPIPDEFTDFINKKICLEF